MQDARHGIAKAFPSIRLSNVCIVTKRKKIMLKFYTKFYPSFVTGRMVAGGRPLVSEILGETSDPVRAKTSIFN